MIITTVKVRKLENSGNKMIGVCTITLDNLIAIHDIKILKTNGMFLAMPSRKTNANTFKDIVHPISEASRKKIEEIIFGLYEITAKSRNTTQEFRCINMERSSMLEQVCSDFETDENRTYSDFVNDDIKKEIESWMS